MDSFNQNRASLAALIAENGSIGVVAPDNHTLDSLAAALSLHLIFQDSGKNSQVVSRRDPIVEHSFLVGIDQLLKNFSGTTKTLTVSFPYKDGDIEKVSYNIEGDRLNVNLFAEERGITFTEKDIRYIRQGSAPQLIVTIGIQNPQDISGFADPATSRIINLDNNVANAQYGEVRIVDPGFSSLSEVVAKLAYDLQLQIEFDVAQNLLDGISSATNNFSSPKTSPLAFEMAGILMQKGAIRKNTKDIRSQSNDTSLEMLGQKNQPQPQQQPKPFPKQNQQFNGQKMPKPFPQQQPKPFPQQQPKPQQAMPMSSFEPQPKFEQPQEESRPQQPRPIEETSPFEQSKPQVMPVPQNEDVSMPQDDSNTDVIPEDQAPSDWFTPKVFKSNKN